ncbi:MAG: hypothetical protein GX444_01940 [Myxococcales bacterium]|nr:hypothetical protein [Myxococcales bacterium]
MKKGFFLLPLLGLATGLILNAFAKALEFMMIANFLQVLILSLAFFFLALGLLRDEAKRRRTAGLIGVAAVAVAVFAASQFNRDFATIALASAIYYPVPLPRSGFFNQLSLVVFLFGVPWLMRSAGRAFADRLEQADPAQPLHLGLFLAGFAAGFTLVYTVGFFGPFGWLLTGLALLLLVAVPWPVAVAALAALGAVLGAYQLYPQHSFFAFGITEYRYLGKDFGRDIKLDFIEYGQPPCLGVVIDNVMMTCECVEPSWIPKEWDFIVRAILYPERFVPQRDPRDPLPAVPDWWKENLRVLSLGHSGTGPTKSLEIYSGPNQNRVVQFDPALARGLSQTYRSYTDHSQYSKESINELASGDFRTELRQAALAGGGYDWVFYSGIGTKTYQLPRSYLYTEHYLLTKEGAALLFDRVLKPDGVFFLDWGSSDTQESRYFVASFPKTVTIAAFWTTESEYPFSGNPLLYVVASKDAAKIAAVKERMKQLSGIYEVDFSENLPFYRTTDNRPFLQPDLHWVFTLCHLLLLPLVYFCVRLFRRRLALTAGPAAWKAGWLFVLIGLAAGMGETIFASFNPFVRGPFGLTSWSVQHLAFLLATAIGFLAVAAIRSPRRLPTRLAPVLIVAALALLFVLSERNAVFLTAPLAGLGFGFLLAGQIRSYQGDELIYAIACYCLGLALALWFLEIPFYFGGYRVVAGLTGALALAVGWWGRRLNTWVKPA